MIVNRRQAPENQTRKYKDIRKLYNQETQEAINSRLKDSPERENESSRAILNLNKRTTGMIFIHLHFQSQHCCLFLTKTYICRDS